MNTMNMNANECDCCREIWNADNLKSKIIGNTLLWLCPDCANEFDKQYISIDKVKSAIKEIENNINFEYYIPYTDSYVYKTLNPNIVLDILGELIKGDVTNDN